MRVTLFEICALGTGGLTHLGFRRMAVAAAARLQAAVADLAVQPAEPQGEVVIN